MSAAQTFSRLACGHIVGGICLGENWCEECKAFVQSKGVMIAPNEPKLNKRRRKPSEPVLCVQCGKQIEKRPKVNGGKWWHAESKAESCFLKATPPVELRDEAGA